MIKVQVQKWGSSLAMRIPKALADQVALQAGSYTNQVDFCQKIGGPSERESTGVGTRKYGKIEQGWYYIEVSVTNGSLVASPVR